VDILVPSTPNGGTDILESSSSKVAQRLLDLSQNSNLSAAAGRILQYVNKDSSMLTPLSDTFLEMTSVISTHAHHESGLMRSQMNEDKKKLKSSNRNEKVLKEFDSTEDLTMAFLELDSKKTSTSNSLHSSFQICFFLFLTLWFL